MKLIPYDSFVIETTASAPELVQRLEEHVEPVRWFRPWLSSNHKEFQGKVSQTGFTISRIIHHRNSFLPTLHGRFEPSPDGAIVHVRMMLSWFVVAFLVLWFGGWGTFALVDLLAFLREQKIQLLLSGGIMVFVWLMVLVGFWWEAGRARQRLERILTTPVGQSVGDYRSGAGPSLSGGGGSESEWAARQARNLR